jgi:S1-C subfamily serine protease
MEVQAGSVAERARLLGTGKTITLAEDSEVPAPGDIIVAIDGERLDSVEDLTLKITYESAAGDELTFSIIRDGAELSIPVTLEASN